VLLERRGSVEAFALPTMARAQVGQERLAFPGDMARRERAPRARGRAASLGNCHGEQMQDPPERLSVCDLEVWRAGGGERDRILERELGPGADREVRGVGGAPAQRLSVTARAVDLGLSWFPDATKLAYVTLVERPRIPPSARAASDPGHPYNAAIAGWAGVPVVAVLDVETGSSELVYEGENPLVSPDGSFLLTTTIRAGSRTPIGGWTSRRGRPVR
jgi:hypothetical protein